MAKGIVVPAVPDKISVPSSLKKLTAYRTAGVE
jgi:hypothetical protein